MTYTSDPARDEENRCAEQVNHTQLILQNIVNIKASQDDVIEAFSQCYCVLSHEQEQRLHKAFNENDCLELGLMLHELITGQI